MSQNTQIITRFPPSPTGMMHIGTARTALFNWLYARKTDGKMLFRIEDTDRARHSEEAVTALINAMKWLELDWDGDIVSQYEQRERHKQVALELLEAGKAWKCYYTQEELEQIRKDNGGFKLPRRAELEAQYSPAQTDAYTIRIEAPIDGSSTIHDAVQGEVTTQNSELDDFVLLRSDGTPTYMLSVVVDDHDMGITHVIRGDDHLNNTFRQNVIYDAMGWEKPVYAHLPLILGPDGAKMSKRHGAASVEEYREMGYLPEAMRNYLLRLGWSHGDDEIITDAQALEWFDLAGCNKAAARFDFDKLESLNSHYIEQADIERLMDLCAPFYKARHDVTLDALARKRITLCADELKSRAKTLLQFTDESAFFAMEKAEPNDDALQILSGDDAANTLADLPAVLASIEEWTSENIMAACKDYAKEKLGGKLGKVGMPLRAKITGRKDSPGIFHVCEALGKDATLRRLS